MTLYFHLARAVARPDHLAELRMEISRARVDAEDAVRGFDLLTILGDSRVTLATPDTWLDRSLYQERPFVERLSQYLEPGAVLWVNGEDYDDVDGWLITGPNQVTYLELALVTADGARVVYGINNPSIGA